MDSSNSSWFLNNISLNWNRQTTVSFSHGLHRWWRSNCEGLITAGASSYVLIYDPIHFRYVGALSGHTGLVQTAEWIPRIGENTFLDEDEIVSGGTDGTVRIWRIKHHASYDVIQWEPAAVLKSHSDSVNAVAVLALPDGATLLASTGADCKSNVWYRAAGETEWIHSATLVMKPGSIMETISMTFLPGINKLREKGFSNLSDYGVVIAVGGSDNQVHFIHLSGVVGAASMRISLSCVGHYDWIRAAKFSSHTLLSTYFGENNCLHSYSSSDLVDNDCLFLSTSSQDGKVRLWKVVLSEESKAELLSGALTSNAKCISNSDNDILDIDDGEQDGEADQAALAALNNVKLGSNMTSREFERILLAAADDIDHQQTLRRPSSLLAPHSSMPGLTFNVTAYALLAAHEGRVQGVNWYPVHQVLVPSSSEEVSSSASKTYMWWQPPCVLSAGADRSLIFWLPCNFHDVTTRTFKAGISSQIESGRKWLQECDADTWESPWTPVLRLGTGGGSAALGLFSVAVSPRASVIVSHGFQGAIHAWTLQDNMLRQLDPISPSNIVVCLNRTGDIRLGSGSGTPTPLPISSSPSSGGNVKASPSPWLSSSAPGGHFGPVGGIAWSRDGSYLVSVSADTTTRIWAPMLLHDSDGSVHRSADYDSLNKRDDAIIRWAEVGRPQIHGYELTCVCFPGEEHLLMTGGSEKVLRTFEGTQLFVHALESVSGLANILGYTGVENSETSTVGSARPRALGAYVPEMNLTSKPILSAEAVADISDRFQLDGLDAAQGAGSDGRDEEEMLILAGKKEKVIEPTLRELLSSPSISKNQETLTKPTFDRLYLGSQLQENGLPPSEEDLVIHSRWPEQDKLFGHWNELVFVTAEPSGILIASSSSARTRETATIKLWVNSHPLKQVENASSAVGFEYSAYTSGPIVSCGELAAHALTVEKMAFCLPFKATVSYSLHPNTGFEIVDNIGTLSAGRPSPLLAAVSRDRQLSVFLRTSKDSLVLLSSLNSHKRQAWACAFAPLSAPLRTAESGRTEFVQLLASGARDSIVKFYIIESASASNFNRAVAELSVLRDAEAAAAASTRVRRGIRSGAAADESLDPALCVPQCLLDPHDLLSTGVEKFFTDSNGRKLTSQECNALGIVQEGSVLAFTCGGASRALEAAVTSLEFAPVAALLEEGDDARAFLLAIGLENGRILMWRVVLARRETQVPEGYEANSASSRGESVNFKVFWKLISTQPNAHAPSGEVRALAWRPIPVSRRDTSILRPTQLGDDGTWALELASCSADTSVRFSTINVKV